MKIKHLLMMAAAMTMVMAGCKKENQPETTLEVSPTSLTFEAAGGSQAISVASNAEWTVEGASHFTLDKTSGKGNATINVSAPASNAETDVVEDITVKAGSKSVKVTLTQKGQTIVAGVSVDPTSLEFAASGDGTKIVKVTATDKWTVTCSEDWIKTSVKGSSAGVDKEVPLTCEDNTSFEARTAKVIITCGDKTAEVAITQIGAKDPTKIYTAEDFINEVLVKDHTVYYTDSLGAIDGFKFSMDTTYTIMNDLDFTGYTFVPDTKTDLEAGEIPLRTSGTVYCCIDGNNKTIKNLYTKIYLIRIFAGEIKDLTFDSSCKAEFAKGDYGLLMYSNAGGIVKNITNNAEITYDGTGYTTTVHVGATMGINRARVEGCKFGGKITCIEEGAGQVRTGGIVGSMTSALGSTSYNAKGVLHGQDQLCYVKNCENTGSITITGTILGKGNSYKGGIAGFLTADCPGGIFDCKFSGSISYIGGGTDFKTDFGGMVGDYKYDAKGNNCCPIENCEVTGTINSGASSNSATRVGGMIGYVYGDPAVAENPSAYIIGGKVAADIISAGPLSEGATNPCKSTGLVFGTHDGSIEQTFYIGTKDKPITVSGSVTCGETKVTATEANLADLVCGANAFGYKFVDINVQLGK